MRKTGDSKRRLGILLIVLAVLVGGITATGYADPPTKQLSGPALVGTLTLVQTDSSVTVSFNGKCRGNGATLSGSVPFSGTLPTTAASLEGFRLPGLGPSGCLFKDGPGGQDLIVKAVAPSKFVNNVTEVTADQVVLLFVLP